MMPTLVTMLLLAAPQDPAALIGKLGSKDEIESSNAKEDLLRAGDPAIRLLREAASKEADAVRKRLLTELADRLDARRNVAGFKGGDLWYAIFKDSLQIGWVHLKAEEKEGALHLSDEIHATPSKDATVSIKAGQVCRKDEYLTLSSATLDIQSPETTVSATARVKDDRLIFQANGEIKATRVQRNMVTDLAVLRLVGLLPATEEYSIDLLQLIKPQEPRSARLRYEREEPLQHDGRAVKARRWTLSDGEDDRVYWVDVEGRLLKAQFKDVEMALTTEAKAKDIDTK